MTSQAQTYLGAHTSNYDPLKAQLFNPALPATSLMKWEVNLFGFDVHAAQDYLRLKGSFSEFGDFDKDVNVEENLNGKDKSGNITMDFQGPGFMVNTKKAGAFAFYWRNRTIIEADNISETFLTSMYNDANNIYNWASDINDDEFAMNVHSFSEMALGYSRQAFQKGNHSLTVGGNLKILTPLASAKVQGNVDITVDEGSETANFGTTEISAISSEIVNFADDDDYQFKFKVSGFAADIGAVYELKTGKGQTKIVGKKKNKVKIQPDYYLKAGIGFNDLGFINHEHSAYSRNFTSAGNTVTLESITQSDSSFIDFDDVLNAVGSFETNNGTFRSKLPSAMTVFADVKLTRGIYINASAHINLGTFSADRPKAKVQNIYSLTPRFELSAIGIALPMAYNEFNGFEMGASIRAGGFVIGSSNIFSYLWDRSATAFDIQFAVAFGRVDKSKKRSVQELIDSQNEPTGIPDPVPAKKKDKTKKDKKNKKDRS